jgi:hypothetical protein
MGEAKGEGHRRSTVVGVAYVIDMPGDTPELYLD